MQSDQIIRDIANEINKPSQSKPNKWIYRLNCNQCPNYGDLNFEIKGEIVTSKFCNYEYKHVINAEGACLYCDFNKANPSTMWIIKYKLNKLWKKNLLLMKLHLNLKN